MNMGWLDEHITSLNRKGEYYNRIAKALTAGHVDFDFGDEILLEQDGKLRMECLWQESAAIRWLWFRE